MRIENDVLCNRLKKGDKKALDEIYSLYYSKVFGFALSYLKNNDDAMDIVQECFIKLWENRNTIKNNTRLEAFIFTITKNSILSLFRKHSTKKKYIEYLAHKVSANTSGTEEQTNFGFLQEKYEKLILQLPTKRKEIFWLSRKEGLSNKEIAEKKGISVKTVENQLTKALAFFKTNLEKGGFLSTIFYCLLKL